MSSALFFVHGKLYRMVYGTIFFVKLTKYEKKNPFAFVFDRVFLCYKFLKVTSVTLQDVAVKVFLDQDLKIEALDEFRREVR